MAKTRLHERAFTLVMAILFLGTGIATGVAVIWSEISQSKNSSSSNSSGSSTGSSTSTTKLAGTKLSGFTPVSNSSVTTLKTIDTKVGTGAVAKAGDTVGVLYTGAVASNGVIFQASTDSSPKPVTISLSQVIKGWQLGIPGMKVGGTRQLLIPAAEAYGANPPSGTGIPANSALVFNVTLLSVQQ